MAKYEDFACVSLYVLLIAKNFLKSIFRNSKWSYLIDAAAAF